MLFDPRAHEPLRSTAWDPAAAAAAIRAIARDTDAALRGDEFWPLHPLDDDGATPDVVHGLYLGAAGVVLALHRLAADGLHDPGHDYPHLAQEVRASHARRPEFGAPARSLFLGEAGVALVAWLLAPAPDTAERLAELVALDDPEGDPLELLYGSPGLLLAADALLARTGEPRWAAAWETIAAHVLDRRGADVPGLWTQRLPGGARQILGAAHGLAGNVAALARRPDLLPAGEAGDADVAGPATAALVADAVVEGDVANWPTAHARRLADADGAIRTQWCHGAPGVVASLAALPRDAALDALLRAGGELTWQAGPLRKGAGLCHGTAGNGFALLKLHARTGDAVWLERARGFAMHAVGQVDAARRQRRRGRYTLWTGDLGTALFLGQCLAATADLPVRDRW